MIHRKHTILTATLASLMLASLSACGSDAEPKAVETVTETVEAEPTHAAAPADSESAAPSETETSAPADDATSESSPEPSEEPEAEPSTSASMGASPELPEQEPQNILGDGKAEFIHFTVESLAPPTEPPADVENTWVYVRTCLNSTPEEFVDSGKTPISADAYGVEISPSGKKLERVQEDALQPAYPEEGTLSPHDCAEGFITFEPITEDIDALTVTYDNSLGEHASWNYH